MKKCLVLCVLLVTTSPSIGPVEAQPGPPVDTARRAELIRKFDVDGDGGLSKEEIETARKAGFEQESEGTVKREWKGEGTAIKNDERMQRLLDSFDKDGNGNLSYEEMEALRESERDRHAASREEAAITIGKGKPEGGMP